MADGEQSDWSRPTISRSSAQAGATRATALDSRLSTVVALGLLSLVLVATAQGMLMSAMDSFNLHAFGPLFAFVAVFAAALGLPVPAMPALILTGGVLAGVQGSPGLALADFFGALLGAAVGDTLWFIAGRRHGFKVLRLLCRISLSRDTCVRRTEGFFERRGVRLLLFARFVPGLSLVSVPMSGSAAVPYLKFVLFDLSGAALWISLGLLLGYSFSNQIDALLSFLQQFGIGLVKLALAIIIGYIAFRWVERQRLLRQLRMSRISASELYALMANGPPPVVIDVRSRESRRLDPYLIPGAQLFDLEKDARELAHLRREGPVIVYCSCPNEASAAALAQRMRKLGFAEVRPLHGGLDAWRKAGWELQRWIEPERAEILQFASVANHRT
ncbi:MAG: Thiosulfate sulfurtransferase GlpE [Nevskia sp.]|nr:Thiosulfate sulfurtransferase GlpE [Nevskia sp.]